MRLDRRLAGTLVCFALSGFAALLFQVAWTREFALVFGTSEVALVTVLAGYMGGLAAGAALCARLAPRIRRPILAYGLLELAIGLCAWGVPSAIRASQALVVWIFGGAGELPSEGGSAIALFYALTSLAIVGLPTACMGATLPLLARSAVHSDAELGPRVAWLYSINTAGAVFGAVCAAFALLPALGLRWTVGVGVGANLTAFALALLISRGAPAPVASAAATPRAALRPGSARMLPFMLASGAASFSYELLWTRLLGHIFGGSLYAFATMLASFLAGIALGSAFAARAATSPERAARAFGSAQLAIAAASLAVFALLNSAPELASAIGAGRDAPLANALVAALLLLPAALGIGVTFPLAVRVVAPGPTEVASAAARVYAWNTVGAIAGSLATGFAGLPWLGYRGVLLAALGVNLALAAGSLSLPLQGARVARGRRLAACAALLLLAGLTPAPLRLLSSSPFDPSGPAPQMLYHGVGRSASVSAVVGRQGALEIRSNGLAESNVRLAGEAETYSYAWLGALASLLRPDARELLVIGFGGGGVLETIPGTVERIDVVEIEPEILRANRAIAGLRARDPLDDPRLRIAVNDVRGALLLTRRRWNAIVSQPSHPWTEGASHLYTQGFFELVRDHLEPGGVFVQWVGLPFLDPTLLKSCAATLLSVFPHVQIYLPYPYGEVYFAASDAPLDWREGARRFVERAPRDAARFGVYGPEDLALALRFDAAASAELARGAQRITDDHNLFQFRTRSDMRAVAALLDPPGRFAAARLAGLDRAYLARRLLLAGRAADAERLHPGAQALLAEYPERLERALALAREERWSEVAALEPGLAAIDPLQAGFPAASELRVRWRLATRDPLRAREAVSIADDALLLANRFELYFWRADALALAGEPGPAATALAQVLRHLGRLQGQRQAPAAREPLRRMALDVLARLPETGLARPRRLALEAWVEALLGGGAAAAPSPQARRG